ncbi:hypothetical protein FOPG_20223 [Fusarium oxysporum f. sp. conglutinans race 2 54008]|uniref:Uncharacterized protein n=1 Tax=Fusarium oxysporum f. sp. conglutinans race 2 54008 TaxID=1089457 RepID=X0GJL9_FUSOX|nr:hypothetical protein FOPG_20223 [Fusarium oxysporum f. sp. conglutinans race 2 54008]
MGEVKLVTVGSEAKESMIDFSEKSGNSLFSTAGSPVTNQEQVEASSSADILLWEEECDPPKRFHDRKANTNYVATTVKPH